MLDTSGVEYCALREAVSVEAAFVFGGAVGNVGRYRRIVAHEVETRGHRCEFCGEAAEHMHHINPVSETGITSELAFEPANMLLLCDDCHCLMHPGTRNRNMRLRFGSAASARGRSLR